MITTAEPGERVTYSGKDAGMRGLPGTVVRPSGDQCKEGCPRYLINFGGAMVLDMCVTVLTKDESEGDEEMPKGRKTVVTHPDGTVSERRSAGNIYIYAVEMREDMWVYAKIQHAQAASTREAKAKFIEAVRGGKVVRETQRVGKDHIYYTIYVEHADGERFRLGSEGGYGDPVTLDRKDAVRHRLSEFDRMAAAHERDARKAEAGPQYRYGVVRWSQSSENGLKGLAEFENRYANSPGHVFRMVPAEAAE